MKYRNLPIKYITKKEMSKIVKENMFARVGRFDPKYLKYIPKDCIGMLNGQWVVLKT